MNGPLKTIGILVIGAHCLAAEELPPVYAELHADLEHIYERERFSIVLTVYSSGPELGSQLNISGLPGAEQLKLGQFEQMVVEDDLVGRHRRVRRYRSVAQAAQAGRIELRPKLQGTVIVRQRGFFRSIQRSRLTIPVRPLALEMHALPDQGRPDGFSGAVGRYSFHVDVEPTALALGDLIHVTMTIRGSGDLAAIPAPALATTDDFKAYPTKALAGDDTESIKFEKTIVPLKSNVAEVAAVRFSYFNPRARSYETIAAGPFPLTFHAQRRIEPRRVHRPQRETAGYQALQLPALKSAPAEWRSSASHRITAAALALHGLPLFIVALSWASSRRRVEIHLLMLAVVGACLVGNLLASPAVDGDADPAAIFHASSQAYADERYQAAIEGYASILFAGYAAAEVQYNLANAHLKAGHAGEGILYLNRAWLDAPGDPEIRASLDAAADFFELARPLTPMGTFQRLSPGQWRTTAITAYWIGCSLVAATGFLRRRRVSFAGAGGTLLVVGLCVVGYESWSHGPGARAAVALEEVTARFAPGDRAIEQFTAKSGEIVQAIARHGTWTKIDRRGDRGWVRSESVGSIRGRD